MSKFAVLFALLALMNAPAQAEDWLDSVKGFLGFGVDPVEAVPASASESKSVSTDTEAVADVPAPTGTDTAMATATAVATDMAMNAGIDSLSDMIAGTLGVTPAQARGGLGSLFNVAKSTLGMADFATLSAAVPEMDSLLAAAPALSEQTKGLSSLMGSAGKYRGALQGATEAYSRFKSLGLNTEQIPQYIAVTREFLQGSGGEEASKLWDKGVKFLSGSE